MGFIRYTIVAVIALQVPLRLNVDISNIRNPDIKDASCCAVLSMCGLALERAQKRESAGRKAAGRRSPSTGASGCCISRKRGSTARTATRAGSHVRVRRGAKGT